MQTRKLDLKPYQRRTLETLKRYKAMMQYKGYSGRVEFDDEAEIFHGEVIGLRTSNMYLQTSL